MQIGKNLSFGSFETATCTIPFANLQIKIKFYNSCSIFYLKDNKIVKKTVINSC